MNRIKKRYWFFCSVLPEFSVSEVNKKEKSLRPLWLKEFRKGKGEVMIKKRSKGVTFWGWLFAIGGFLGFLMWVFDSALFFWHKPLWMNFRIRLIRAFAPQETMRIFFTAEGWLTDEIFMSDLTFTVIKFILIPTVFFLILLSGNGILKLQNRWRNTIFVIWPLSLFLKFIMSIYIGVSSIMVATAGSILDVEYNVPLSDKFIRGVMRFKLYMSIAVKNLLPGIILMCIAIYFFTRPKVKAQFSPEREKVASNGSV